ncbi:hypothetical protein BJ165DRAFT_1410394 [Panaeolus papilionaceus]|nr:hypothetical protein BJ165DRAFT_1410394 [Panaeolus papilionaceus]
MPRVATNPFLDLEADVDRNAEEEEDEDEEEMQDFIDFDEVQGESQSVEEYQTWNALQTAQDEGSDNSLDEDREVESFLAHLERYKPNATGFDVNSDSLPKQRYPLHRVACRAGMEEEALTFILQKTRNESIASVLFRESIRGYIYMEAIVDQPVIQLLTKTPGIRRTTRGPIMQGVDEPDWNKLLTMKPALSSYSSIKEGEWVTVKNGKVYKGDTALVKRIDAWGVEVLVVPRIPPLAQSLQKSNYDEGSKKRKTIPAAPEAQLFQDWDMARAMGLDVVEDAPHCYHFGNNFFEYGLLRRSYSFHSLRAGVVSIPASTFHFFINSHHPSLCHSIDQLPKPREWIIEEGDIIEDSVSKRRGTVLRIHTMQVEFSSDDHSGLHALPWRFVRKVVKVADYVELASGEKGWVVEKSDDILHVVNKPEEQVGNSSAEIIAVDVHVNRIRHSTMPFVASTVQQVPVIPAQKDYIPWVGTRVLVTKGAWKGRHARIQTVFRHEENLKLLVRLENYNPHHAFNDINLGVDDVVEAVEGAYANTGDNWNLGTPLPTPAATSPTLASAWDPNSRTPAGFETPRINDNALQIATSSEPPSIIPATPSHPLLDPRLLNIKMKANVHGGGIPGTEMAVWLSKKDDGSLAIQCARGGKNGWLQPNWLEIRRPNPARADNGLMVVVDHSSGHFGKLVRRVSHFKNANRILMRCVVVTCESGNPNVITQEELDSLDKDQLCLCFETKEEKEMNKAVISQLRARGRVT